MSDRSASHGHRVPIARRMPPLLSDTCPQTRVPRAEKHDAARTGYGFKPVPIHALMVAAPGAPDSECLSMQANGGDQIWSSSSGANAAKPDERPGGPRGGAVITLQTCQE